MNHPLMRLVEKIEALDSGSIYSANSSDLNCSYVVESAQMTAPQKDCMKMVRPGSAGEEE